MIRKVVDYKHRNRNNLTLSETERHAIKVGDDISVGYWTDTKRIDYTCKVEEWMLHTIVKVEHYFIMQFRKA